MTRSKVSAGGTLACDVAPSPSSLASTLRSTAGPFSTSQRAATSYDAASLRSARMWRSCSETNSDATELVRPRAKLRASTARSAGLRAVNSLQTCGR